MADDQTNKPLGTAPLTNLDASRDNKPSTIDDLVKELSKNNGPNQPPLTSSSASQKPPSPLTSASQGLPPNLPGIKIDNKPFDVAQGKPSVVPPPSAPIGGGGSFRPEPPRPEPSLTRPPQPPLAGGLSRPQPFSSPPSPPAKPPIPSASLSKLSGVQEYRSSIRTMGEDISSIKSGQKPSGIDIPRKITPEIPTTPGVPRPAPLPSPLIGGPISSIGLGKSEKTGPLPVIPTPKKPDELSKPIIIKPPITVPDRKTGFNPVFYMLIASILAVGGFLYWYLVLRVSEPEIILSPTPTIISTPAPAVKTLGEIFTGAPVNFEILTTGDIGNGFGVFVKNLDVPINEFLKINFVENVDNILLPLSFLDILEKDFVAYPTDLKNNVTDLIVAAYGQTETFKEDGSFNLDLQDVKKTVFVAKIRDSISVQAIMRDWEFTIADDLADYLLVADTSKEAGIDFLDNVYREVSIRYRNFPFPDITVDYAAVNSSGQNYLVISGSREAIYSAIDVLLEQ
ncbi:MAG: hypothetical protein A3J46_03185 [Candidatus Yanofskybacteria bacterium RIFCSPHIGHO2_02_FULL_41_11]|uniref:Uncharacterized protein n=1 Tax=Candidatus Yanofskybacteria bacterium RIFCSPHIGHO2_02_FULL_41_11 TaxID=1802675 RepID=A0A1F8F9D3_9BACT|nr:MAG: hypothetical protein A3J46_03185 [Candidatus Yanofskybacteria bacterium RIFCSPHIGHO2_02_FULL_41_11]